MTAALEGGEWSAARPGRNLSPGKTRYPLYRRLGGPPGPVWTGGKSRLHQDSIPDRPARSQSLYWLSYPAHTLKCTLILFFHIQLDLACGPLPFSEHVARRIATQIIPRCEGAFCLHHQRRRRRQQVHLKIWKVSTWPSGFPSSTH